MASPADGRRQLGQLWRSDWLVGVLVVVSVFVLHSFTDIFGTLERRYYDFASTSTARQPSARIAIIAIDDQSIANIGRWPWPRDVQAKLIDQLSAAKAKTIVNTTLFMLCYMHTLDEYLTILYETVRLSYRNLTSLDTFYFTTKQNDSRNKRFNNFIIKSCFFISCYYSHVTKVLNFILLYKFTYLFLCLIYMKFRLRSC